MDSPETDRSKRCFVNERVSGLGVVKSHKNRKIKVDGNRGESYLTLTHQNIQLQFNTVCLLFQAEVLPSTVQYFHEFWG